MSSTGAAGAAQKGRGSRQVATPYKVVSNKTENILRRDLNSLDKQQTYILKRVEHEQRAFKRSLDSLQAQRNRSTVPHHTSPGHGTMLSVPGFGVSSASPTMSRHLASAGMTSGNRSVSASVPMHGQQASSRQAVTSRSKTRAGVAGSMPSPVGDRRLASSAMSPLAKNASMAKSWTPNNSWKKPPTGLSPPDLIGHRAASAGNIRDPDLFGIEPPLSVQRPDHHHHSTLPPIVNPASASQARSSTNLSRQAHPSSPAQTGGKGQHQGRPHQARGLVTPEIGYATAPSPLGGRHVMYAGDSDGEANLAGSHVRIVKSSLLFEDLTTSLHRITSSRPGTAVAAANGSDSLGHHTDGGLGIVDSDGNDTDGEVISNGFEEGIMGENAQGGKTLAKLMDDIKGCRYIRHYSTGQEKEDPDQQDAVKKIFAD